MEGSHNVSRARSPPTAVSALQHLGKCDSKQGSRSQYSGAPLAASSCPFAPSIPQYAGLSRTSRVVDQMQPPGNDLADLRAALHDAGVHTELPLHHHNSNTQQTDSNYRLQQLRHNMDMQHKAVSRAAATTGSADSLDLNRLAEELQQRSGRLSNLQMRQQMIDAQLMSTRPSFSRHGRSAGSIHLSKSQEMAAATGIPILERPASSSSSDKAVAPVQQAGVVSPLTSQLVRLQEKLKAASAAKAASGSCALSSSTEQPPTPALALPAAQVAANSAAASDTQQLAEAGMAQLQEMTQLSQQVWQAQTAASDQAAATRAKLLELRSFFQQHPELHNAAALQCLVESNKELKNELFATRQRHDFTLRQLREQNNTPVDKRYAGLQQQVQDLKDQLHKRDVALIAAEQDNRRLRDELGIGPASINSSPRAKMIADAKQTDRGEVSGVQRQLTYHREGSSSSYSSSSHSSVSGDHTASGQCKQQLDKQETPAVVIRQMTATFETALAAKEQQVLQLQQQLDEVRSAADSKQRACHPTASVRAHQRQRLSHQPRTLDEAIQQIASLNEIVSQQQEQLHEQEQQASRRASECETAFRRQLEVEKKQHECTRANCKLITEQLEQLQERLAKSQEQQLQLQQQLEQATDGLQEVDSVSHAGRQSEVDHIRQLQQHVQEQKQQIGQLQSCIQGLYVMIRSAGKLVDTTAGHQHQQLQGMQDPVPQLLKDSVKQLLADAAQQQATASGISIVQNALDGDQQQQHTELKQLKNQLHHLQLENKQLQREVDSSLAVKEQCEQEVRQQALRMQQSAEMLMQMKDLRDKNQQLQQDVTALRAQLDKALQEQQLSTAHLESCRQQLTEANQHVADCQAERDVLMDRIRQLADRASAAEVSGRVTPASASASEMVQLQMSQACAELNKQVSVLSRELSEREVKEERLQVVNAQLQERNAQLQEQISKLQGAADAAFSSDAPHIQQHAIQQQLQQQLQEKEQQLLDLQAQQDSSGSPENDVSLEQLRAELADRTQELIEWQIHADALEKDLVDLKERADAADNLQDQLDQQQRQLAVLTADKEELQKELEETKDRVAQLEFDLHGAGKDHSALLTRFEAVKAELARVKDAAADMKLRLEHYTGPAGPQGRIRQLEASLQNVQRKYEAADSRAANAVAEVKDLRQKLSNAEDSIMSLEGQISILEKELARYSQ